MARTCGGCWPQWCDLGWHQGCEASTVEPRHSKLVSGMSAGFRHPCEVLGGEGAAPVNHCQMGSACSPFRLVHSGRTMWWCGWSGLL